MKLTPKQKAFCDHYIVNPNATEAALKAGYSKKTAYSQGQRLLKNVEIKNYMDERMSKKEKKRVADQDEILEFLTRILRNEETEEVPVSMQNKFEMVEKKPSLKDRTKAAELLGKRFALFKEQDNNKEVKRIIIVEDFEDDD